MVTQNTKGKKRPYRPSWQLQLPFDGKRETDRQARVERILGQVPAVETVAHLFDEAAYREATRIARATHGR